MTIHHYDRFASDEDDVAVERSQPTSFLGVPFYIEACFVQDAQKRRLLECSLVCDFDDEATRRFAYNAAVSFRLERPEDALRMKVSSEIICNTFKEDFCRLSYQWVEDAVIFNVNNDAIMIQVSLREGIPFRLPQVNLTRPMSRRDIRFVVSGHTFFVNPGFMATLSPCFAKHIYPFDSEETGAVNVVKLEGVDWQEFETFLKAVHDFDDPVNKENVAVLMTLADRYSVDSLLNKCETFLVKNKAMSLLAKLMLVERLNVVHIRASSSSKDCDDCLIATCKHHDIADLCHEPNLKELSAECLAQVLDKFIQLSEWERGRPMWARFRF
ncbi:CRE-BATH-38 protein [Aphelenchoides avenae]|nr:CRE-BATH-38 protein [Aphelenchus avenae]